MVREVEHPGRVLSHPHGAWIIAARRIDRFVCDHRELVKQGRAALGIDVTRLDPKIARLTSRITRARHEELGIVAFEWQSMRDGKTMRGAENRRSRARSK